MKKHLVFFIILSICSFAFGQNDYSQGFANGYKEGYCYNEFGCIAPIAPNTPLPYLGESSSNYQSGYNRGFKRGLEDKQGKQSNSEGYRSGLKSSNLKSTKSVFEKEMDEFAASEAAYHMRKVESDKNQAIAEMQTIRTYYSSFSKYPDKISNGWHKVIAMNNLDFCEERKVYVENNKISKYIIDDFTEKIVTFSGPIIFGKGLIGIDLVDSSQGSFLEIYFIEDIINPSAIVSAPIKPGTVSFWTNWKKADKIIILFDDIEIGYFQNYFTVGIPDCGQRGTITISCRPGTYNYNAKAFMSSKSWSGTVTIQEGLCSLVGILVD